MADLRVNVTADVSKAKKDLKGLENDIKRMQRTASKPVGGKGGAGGLSGKGGGFNLGSLGSLGGGGFLGKIGGFAAAAGPYVAAAAAAIKGIKAMNDAWANINKNVYAYNAKAIEMNEKFGAITKSFTGTTAGVKALTANIQYLGANGTVPVDQLQQSAGRLLMAFKGNTVETTKFTHIIADLAAATGRSTDEIADVIVKVESLGYAEESNIKQLQEMGIPIYQGIAKELGISVGEAKELVKAGKLYTAEFEASLEAAKKLSAETANTRKNLTTVQQLQRENERTGRLFGNGADGTPEERQQVRSQKRLNDKVEGDRTNKFTAALMGEAPLDWGVSEVNYQGRAVAEDATFLGGQISDRFRAWFTDDHQRSAQSAIDNSKRRTDKYSYAKEGAGLHTGGNIGEYIALGHFAELKGSELTPAQVAQMLVNGEVLDKQGNVIEDVALGDPMLAGLLEEIQTLRKLSGGDLNKIKEGDILRGGDGKNIPGGDLDFAINHPRGIDDATRKEAAEQLKVNAELLEYLVQAYEIRKKQVEEEKKRLLIEKRGKELQFEQLAKDKEYVAAWNAKNTGADKWTGAVGDGKDALKRYNEGLALIREGKGTDQIAAYVKYWEAFAKEEEKRLADEKKRRQDRREYELNHNATTRKVNAGYRFKLDLTKAQEEMRKLGYDDTMMWLYGEDLKRKAEEPYSKEYKEKKQQYIDTAAKLAELGVKPTQRHLEQRAQQWKYDAEEQGIPHKKISYERGAWGQGLRLEETDPVAVELAQQRKELTEQLKVLEEQRDLAKEQLAAIKAIDTTPKAQ